MSPADQRAAVISEALSWLGTPHHHAARLKGVGVDCGYFLAEVYQRAIGLDRMDFGHYPEDWMMHRDAERYLIEVRSRARQIDNPQPGDIALFQWGRAFAHGVIVVEWPRVIHAVKPAGVCLGEADQPPLRGRAALFFSPFALCS